MRKYNSSVFLAIRLLFAEVEDMIRKNIKCKKEDGRVFLEYAKSPFCYSLSMTRERYVS